MMEGTGILTILPAAFGLGMLHALDADHIAAVANLAGNGQDRRMALLTSVWWAMGHGLALMSLGAGMLIIGMAIPEEWNAVAENAVAIALIVIGAWVLWDLNRRGVHLHFHRHDDRVLHGHLHAHDDFVSRRAYARIRIPTSMARCCWGSRTARSWPPIIWALQQNLWVYCGSGRAPRTQRNNISSRC